MQNKNLQIIRNNKTKKQQSAAKAVRINHYQTAKAVILRAGLTLIIRQSNAKAVRINHYQTAKSVSD